MIATLLEGHELSEAQAEEAFARLVAGQLSEVEMAALLVALKMRGESPAVMAGAARAMRAAAGTFEAGIAVADSCGTGGDGAHTFNVSTAAALVAAECGVPVAKHGNRSVSSRCGSADVLETLGIELEASADASRRALADAGVCFLYAPAWHSGLRHAAPVRRALGVRTVLNLLGPLVNPARPRWQVVGVYDARWCVPMAETLGRLGCASALVVNGDGLDEIALHGPTSAALLRDGDVRALTFSPHDAGLPVYGIERLAGGDVAENAQLLTDLLQGRGDEAHVAAVAINAGALLWVAGQAADLAEGTARALDVLRTDRAWLRFERWRETLRGTR